MKTGYLTKILTQSLEKSNASGHKALALTLDISRTSSKYTRKILSKFITKLENEGKFLGG